MTTPTPIPDETGYYDIWEQIKEATGLFYPKPTPVPQEHSKGEPTDGSEHFKNGK